MEGDQGWVQHQTLANQTGSAGGRRCWPFQQ